MELTPQLLTDEIDFRVAVRGYDRNEVDDFLERVAVAVGQLQTQLTKAVARAKTAEARVAELEARGPSSDEPSVPAEVDVPVETAGAPPEVPDDGAGSGSVAEQAPGESAPIAVAAPVPIIIGDENTSDELGRALVMAQRAADTAIREANEEAKQIIENATAEAKRNREAAEAAHAKAREEARGRLVAEIRELEATREAMRDDTVVLERHLGTERARVRETIQVLRRLVDDPGSFRTASTPELSGVTTPAELEAGPVSTPMVDEDGNTADAADPAVVRDESSIDDVVETDAVHGDSDAVTETDEAGSSDGSSADEAEPEAVDPGARPAAVIVPAAPPAAPGSASSTDDASEPTVTDSASGQAESGQAESDQPASESERLGQLFGDADTAKDWRNAGPERGDQGPHTQPVAAARFEEESDDAFLAELRRAMNDDEPLGPGKD